MKTICASILFISLSATLATVCSANPAGKLPLNNPIYSSRNYKQPYSSKWQEQSAISGTDQAFYNTRLADYKHLTCETNLAIGSLSSHVSTSRRSNQNYKTQHGATWQPTLTEEAHPVIKHHKHHHNTVGN